MEAARTRIASIDVARGALLAGMVAVHVASAHGTAGQVNSLHAWFGIFLISAGFVWLSGFVAALGPPRGMLRPLRIALQLLLTMVAYAVLLSLVRHLVERWSGGDIACAARAGWSPPVRFEDLGILLPIALTQLLAAPLRGKRWASVALAALAVASLLLLGLSADGPRAGLSGLGLDVLVRRTLTPFYSVCVFIALGLAGTLAGGSRISALLTGAPRRAPSIAGLSLALAMGVPAWSQAVLDIAYRAGPVVGAVATLAYWTAAIVLFLRGLVALSGPAARALALLGRHSLYVFVLHDFLLEGDALARARLHLDKGVAVVVALVVVNVAVLLVAALAIDRSDAVRAAARAFLLDTARAPRQSRATFAVPAGLALAGLLAVYTSAALARTRAEVLVDDFESMDECPRWWTFGSLQFRRIAPDLPPPGNNRRALDVAGRLAAPSGTGVYLQQEIGPLRTLQLDVRGYGPDSGRLRIELFDDDNGNWDIEKDPQTYEPLYDDRFVLELPVDWTGWRQLALPAAAFHDDNPGIGNDVFDPERDLTSGGLLEMQFIFTAASPARPDVHMQIDDVRWTP
jgi:fucose 4-O-acetylase-like acetyltransferase